MSVAVVRDDLDVVKIILDEASNENDGLVLQSPVALEGLVALIFQTKILQ